MINNTIAHVATYIALFNIHTGINGIITCIAMYNYILFNCTQMCMCNCMLIKVDTISASLCG